MKTLSKQIFILLIALVFSSQKCGNEPPEFSPETDITSLERGEYIQQGPVAYDLITEQNSKIGEIIVWNTADTLFVKYTLQDEDFCFTATQLHVAGSREEIPVSNEGNPSPMQYEYQDRHDCETEIVYGIDLGRNGWECGNEIQFSARAMVSTQQKCNTEAFIFGAESETGSFYSIDLTEAFATLLFDVEALATDQSKTPVGLAYDEYSQRLYFGISNQQTSDSCALFFFDGTEVKEAGYIEGNISGATFFEGNYYFINDKTTNLSRAAFNENGQLTSAENLFTELPADNATWRFSDIVMSYDGASLYGIATSSQNKLSTLLSFDLISCKYSTVFSDSITGRQLAYGSDGILYGYNAKNKEFYSLKPESGTISRIGTLTNIEQEFKSLASGPFCIPREQEAWSRGDTLSENDSFPTSSYEITCNDDCRNWESAIAWGGPNEGDGAQQWFYLDATGEKPQQLFTNEGPVPGSKISYIDGELSIEPGSSVILKNQTETIRINGYYEYTLPAEKPDTEVFEIKRDKDYSLTNINIGYYDYLVIWMDVWICRE